MARTLGPVGANITYFEGTKNYDDGDLVVGRKRKVHLVDSGGCEPGSNKGAKIEHVKVYSSTNIELLHTLPGAVRVEVSGSYLPADHPMAEKKTRRGIVNRSEIDYPGFFELKISSTVKTVELHGIGNIAHLKIPNNVKVLEISFCSIGLLEFSPNCELDTIMLFDTEFGDTRTGKKQGVWPKAKKFNTYECDFYSDVKDYPNATVVATNNDYKRKKPNFYRLPRACGRHYGKGIEIHKTEFGYHGIGRKFTEQQLITFCTRSGMLDVLDHFKLASKVKYPVNSRPQDQYSVDKKKLPKYINQSYDDKRSYSLECYNGTPVIQNSRWIDCRRTSRNVGEGCTIFPYLNPKTKRMDYIDQDKVRHEPLTLERYEYLLKSLAFYFGPDWRKYTVKGDVTASEGLFDGLLLTETDFPFRIETLTTIDKLDWTKLPPECSVLTMHKNGDWWGNEFEAGLRAEGGSWVTYGGTGQRWVNICEKIGINIKPVDDWKKMYKRPKDQIVPIPPKPKDFGLCPFSGSGRNPDRPKRICSRTEDGSKGDCSTCRVAAEWEEAYG